MSVDDLLCVLGLDGGCVVEGHEGDFTPPLFCRAYLCFLGCTNEAWYQSWPAKHIKGGILDTELIGGAEKAPYMGEVCWQLHSEPWRWQDIKVANPKGWT